ncbi:MAG: substrate-binding domain-containing protein, partial [Bacteroidota bacterium]
YQQDYRVMLCQSDESHEKEVADANALFGSRVDGVMISLAHETQSIDHLRIFQDTGIPLVFFDKTPDDMPGISKVVVDDYLGAYQAVTHLIEQGHKKIAHFRGPVEASTSRNRLKGYQDALEHHGIQLDDSLIFSCKNISLEEGSHFAKALHQLAPDCTALFAVTDLVAIGAMLTYRELGVEVPNQMAICGFSNNPISSIIQPSLSSVSQPSLEMGKLAAEILLKEIHANMEDLEFHPETITLQTKLTIRTSSAHQISYPHVT